MNLGPGRHTALQHPNPQSQEDLHTTLQAACQGLKPMATMAKLSSRMSMLTLALAASKSGRSRLIAVAAAMLRPWQFDFETASAAAQSIPSHTAHTYRDAIPNH